MNRHYLQFLSTLVLVLLCSGCLKSPIKNPHNLRPLTKETAHDSQTKEQVTVHAKKLTPQDQEEIFGSYTQSLNKYQIIPVQITIENSSTTCWCLTEKSVGLKSLTLDQVNDKLFAARRFRPLWIFLGGTAASLILGPVIGFAISVFMIPAHVGCPGIAALTRLFILGIISGTVAGALFLATSCATIVDAVSYHMSRKQMREYLTTNFNSNGFLIQEGISASMVYFVEQSELPDRLALVLVDKDVTNNSLHFDLAL